MDYKIVRANREIGQIEVAYEANGKVMGVYAIDLPVIDGAFLSGEALHKEIVHRAPLWAIDREREVATATGFEQIEALVQPIVDPAQSQQEAANAAMWAKVEFERQVAEVLVKFGLMQADPTAIPTTVL